MGLSYLTYIILKNYSAIVNYKYQKLVNTDGLVAAWYKMFWPII